MIDDEKKLELILNAKETFYVKGHGLFVRPKDSPQIEQTCNGIRTISGTVILVEQEKPDD